MAMRTIRTESRLRALREEGCGAAISPVEAVGTGPSGEESAEQGGARERPGRVIVWGQTCEARAAIR